MPLTHSNDMLMIASSPLKKSNYIQMKKFIKSPTDINKIEYWAATTLFVFSVFFLVSGSVSNRWQINQYEFNEAHQQYSYFNNYFVPTLFRYITFYGAYCLLTFVIVPPLSKKKRIILNIILAVGIFYLISLILAATDSWTKGYLFEKYKEEELYSKLFQDNALYSLWLLMMFALYTSIKLVAIYLLENSDLIQSKYRVITRDGIYAFILWMIGLFVLLIGKVPQEAVIVLATCSIAGIGLYCYSQYALLPEAFRKAKPFKAYFKKFATIVLLSTLPLFFVLFVLIPGNKEEIALVTCLFNSGFQLLFTAPLSWYLYKHRMTVDYEIKGLQTALGRSTADLHFLRSQINPHFLFNVLNTLYGTALQEKAELTSEGIQKLGDMMRFMLRENMQEKISLNREIEYLNNYIALQTLRTQSSPGILINTEIEEHLGSLQIAPMLLIPFVENAFKHGISLKETSTIRISLLSQDKSLYFDVSNTIHSKNASDPEKDNNGIGLNNVQQRLRLLYPGRHELSIRENGKEFFIHLTIQLD